MKSAILLAALMAAPLPALAHHSISAIYDRGKDVTVEGRVTKVELINPHSLLHLEVVAPGGAKTAWTAEGRGKLGMDRAGFSDDTVKAGDLVKVSGFPAHNGGPALWLQSLTTPSGKSFDFVRR